MATLGKPKFEAFDVVELTEAIPGHDRGARGTIVVPGPNGHALVDFAWSPKEADCADVPASSLCVIERPRNRAVPTRIRR